MCGWFIDVRSAGVRKTFNSCARWRNETDVACVEELAVRRTSRWLSVILAIIALMAAACTGGTTPSQAPSAAPSASGNTKLSAIDYKSNLIKPDTIIAATSGTSPPSTSLNASGQPDGYEVERCKEDAKRLGLNLELVVIDFAASLTGLQTGRFDMTCTGVTRTKERLDAKQFLLTNGTIHAAATVVVLANDPRIKSLEDLRGSGMRGGGSRGAFQIKQLQDALGADSFTIQEYPGGAQEMQLDLKAKRIDFYIAPLLTAAYQVKLDPELRLGDDKGIGNRIQAEAVRKEEPGLLEAINLVEGDLLADGTIEALQTKWFGKFAPPPAVEEP